MSETPTDDGKLQPLREPLNVDELKERDRLVRRRRKLRADAVLDKHTIEHWNRAHPNDPPLSTAFEDAMIAFCDGKGPLPENADV